MLLEEKKNVIYFECCSIFAQGSAQCVITYFDFGHINNVVFVSKNIINGLIKTQFNPIVSYNCEVKVFKFKWYGRW